MNAKPMKVYTSSLLAFRVTEMIIKNMDRNDPLPLLLIHFSKDNLNRIYDRADNDFPFGSPGIYYDKKQALDVCHRVNKNLKKGMCLDDSLIEAASSEMAAYLQGGV